MTAGTPTHRGIQGPLTPSPLLVGGAPAPNVGDTGFVDPTRAMRTTFKGIATVVAPASLVTALLFYFGWSRSSAQASLMGLDDSLFGFSTRDYLLLSIDAMFWPLFVGATTVLGALAVHATVVRWEADLPAVDPIRRRLLHRGTTLLTAVGALALALGTLGVRRSESPGLFSDRAVSLYSPVCITVGIVAIGYALHIRRRYLRRAPRRPDGPELATVRLVAGSVIVLILLLSVFWNVSRYAQVKGYDLAVELERSLSTRPDVTVYSAKRLHLEAPVTETALAGEASAYLYRYAGLKLLFRSEHTYFLRPAGPAGVGVNVLVTESPDIRVEFAAPL